MTYEVIFTATYSGFTSGGYSIHSIRVGPFNDLELAKQAVRNLEGRNDSSMGPHYRAVIVRLS